MLNGTVRDGEVRVESIAHAPVEEASEVFEVGEVVESVDRRLETPVDIVLLGSPPSREVLQTERPLVKQYRVEPLHSISTLLSLSQQCP